MFARTHLLKLIYGPPTHRGSALSASIHPTSTGYRCLTSGIALSLCFTFSSNLALADDRFETFTAATAGASLSLEGETVNPQARGVLKAKETAIIAAGMTGRLIKAGYKSGQTFKRGALLARFDCSQEQAELTALKQAYETLSLKHQNQDQLFKAGAAGALDVSVARSEMAQASAETEALKARLKKCSVYAPYAGIVAQKHVAAFETPAQNAPLYTLHRAGQPEISVIIPSKWLRAIDKGSNFTFTVDETATQLKGQVMRIGAAVDPVSQTIEITGRIIGSTGRALSGMSGIAQFDGPDGP